MESEWRVFLREARPDLYEHMMVDLRWSSKWRDELISKLRFALRALLYLPPGKSKSEHKVKDGRTVEQVCLEVIGIDDEEE